MYGNAGVDFLSDVDTDEAIKACSFVPTFLRCESKAFRGDGQLRQMPSARGDLHGVCIHHLYRVRGEQIQYRLGQLVGIAPLRSGLPMIDRLRSANRQRCFGAFDPNRKFMVLRNRPQSPRPLVSQKHC